MEEVLNVQHWVGLGFSIEENIILKIQQLLIILDWLTLVRTDKGRYRAARAAKNSGRGNPTPPPPWAMPKVNVYFVMVASHTWNKAFSRSRNFLLQSIRVPEVEGKMTDLQSTNLQLNLIFISSVFVNYCHSSPKQFLIQTGDKKDAGEAKGKSKKKKAKGSSIMSSLYYDFSFSFSHNGTRFAPKSNFYH